VIGGLLFLVFLVLPVVELYVIIQVGHAIGVLNTIGLLILISVVGAWIVKREGARAWGAFRLALTEGRVPARETADGALVILGGALLVTPGFVSDVLGTLLVLPPTRALVRRLVMRMARNRVEVYATPARRVTRVASSRMSERRAANEPPAEPPRLPPE